MLLTARRAFTGTTDQVPNDPVLAIEDGRIVEILSRGDVAESADVVDLGNVTLLPGLIDVHQHLAFDASPDPVAQLQADDDAALLERMHRHAHRALDVGITTIRDLGDRGYLSLELRDRFAGTEVGPRIVASGPPITTPNGHCWFLGGSVEGLDGIRAAVRQRAARGVDVIKIMASGGNMTPPSGPMSPSSGRPSWRWRSKRPTPPGCRWPSTLTAARLWPTPSPWAPTRSSTARSSPPTASTPTPVSSNSSPPAAA